MNWWQKRSKEGLWQFLRKGDEGRTNQVRLWFERYMQSRHKGKKVLDCGCGAGVDYEYLKDICDYTGIDITPKMIELCHENFPEGIFWEMDMEAMLFPNDVFDVVFCRAVLEHLEDYKEALSEMKRVCKSGGFVIAMLFHPLTAKPKKQQIDDNTWNNYYNEKLATYLGEVYARYPVGGYQIIIWQKE